MLLSGWRCRILVVLALAFASPIPALAQSGKLTVSAAHGESNQEVCNPLADYFLGMEDYPEALRLHKMVIREHPDNALAHYHLGFIYGMMGKHRLEMAEYQKAVDLGLSDWQLFLNLGLLDLERGDLVGATQVLSLATLLGPEHPETHFNLGLAYERRGELRRAEQEMIYAVRLEPSRADARNTLGVIYAQEGDYRRAGQEWTELEETIPGYPPAVANLEILRRIESRKTSEPVGDSTPP